MPAELIEAEVEAERAKDAFDVYPENEHAVAAFNHLSTQWRLVAGMNGVAYIGLDYGSVPPVLDLMAITAEERPRLFRALRVMESAALAVLNQKLDADG